MNVKNKEYKKLLSEGANKLKIDLSEQQIEELFQYMDLLIQWNKKINLTAIEDKKEIIIKHFIDSMTPLIYDKVSLNSSIIDIGTGAGFPGIVMKIVRPDIKVVLLDSLQKRIKFLEEVIGQLALKNIKTIHGRAEDLAKEEKYRERFDICISRAVANLAVLSEYCLPFVKIGGIFISMKGKDIEEEKKEAEKAIKILGGKTEQVSYISLPYIHIKHSLIFIKKERQCPTKYPRKAGKPSKEPLK